ncbi:MAG: hypothetical protein RR854_00275 [Muribaculaceae bacterium]
MEKNEMKELYKSMYNKHIVEGKDTEVMKIWGEKEKEFVCEMIEKYPDCAKKYIIGLESAIEAKDWNNYVSKNEMEKIMSTLMPSAKWSREEVIDACCKLGVPYENKPKWNTCALVVVMNMTNSDHRDTLLKFVTDENTYVTLVYNLAVDKLEDEDRPCFLREYFETVIW